jgi:HEPN domain-containing protein
MTSEEKYAHWLSLAEYDLGVADAMYRTGKWFYVAFMCQQAFEKHCKGLYNFYIGDDVPKVHNIPRLLNDIRKKLSIPIEPDVYELADALSSLYLNNRYLDFEEKPAMRIDKTRARALIKQTKEALKWLLTLKK